MLLNRLEYALMNNPIRAVVQRRIEAHRLLRLGGRMRGGVALEIGCGRGVGAELILDMFGAERVDAFDLDPRMIARAQSRLRGRGACIRLWVGDVTLIPAPTAIYDAVFDFGIIHDAAGGSVAPEDLRLCATIALQRTLAPGESAELVGVWRGEMRSGPGEWLTAPAGTYRIYGRLLGTGLVSAPVTLQVRGR